MNSEGFGSTMLQSGAGLANKPFKEAKDEDRVMADDSNMVNTAPDSPQQGQMEAPALKDMQGTSLDDLFRVLQLPDDAPLDELMASVRPQHNELPGLSSDADANPLDSLFQEEARRTPPLRERKLPDSFFGQGMPDPMAFGQQQQQQQQQPGQSQYAMTRTSVQIIKDDSLPPGWEAARTSDGLTYYVNHIQRTTQWDRPVMTWADGTQATRWGPASPSTRRRSSITANRRTSVISTAARRGSAVSSTGSLADLRRHTVGSQLQLREDGSVGPAEGPKRQRDRSKSLDVFLSDDEPLRGEKRRRSIQYDLETCLEDVVNDQVRTDFAVPFDPDAFGSILESLTSS